MRNHVLVGAFALLAAACGSGSAGAQQTPPPAAAAQATPTPQTIAFTESEFKIEPATLTLKPGTYVLKVTSQGSFPHDLHLSPQGTTTDLGSIPVIKNGESQSVTVTLAPGVYTYWCAVGKHREKGMEGTLTVRS